LEFKNPKKKCEDTFFGGNFYNPLDPAAKLLYFTVRFSAYFKQISTQIGKNKKN